MPMVQKHKPEGGGGGGGWEKTLMKAFLLTASALFLVSVSISVKIDAGLWEAREADNASSGRLLPLKEGRMAKSEKAAGTIGGSSNNSSYAGVADDDETVLKWLRRLADDAAATSIPQLLSSPVKFTPGTLPLSQLSALRHCRIDPGTYRAHYMTGPSRRVPYSRKHNLAYILLPKSGSSTGRFMMKHEFDADEQTVQIKPPMNVIAFVRDPLSRFFSQYDEAYARTAPWSKGQNPFYRGQGGKGGGKPHPFPYLYEGMNTYHEYEDVFCPPSTRRQRKDCIYRETKENGTLAHRLERFVRDYDGLSPYDVHLALQVPMLSDVGTGRAFHITELHNTTNAEGDWQAIARRYLGEDAALEKAKRNSKGAKESGGVIMGRSFPRRFDKKFVGASSGRRICELALLDYCCLNFPLPASCAGEDGYGDVLSCEMDRDEGEGGGFVIRPGRVPSSASE